jgi:hypothetical protein
LRYGDPARDAQRRHFIFTNTAGRQGVGAIMSSNFYAETIAKSSWAHNPNAVCKDIAMLEPGTRAKVQALISDAKANGHDIRVLETYRSQARQTQLFHEGKTQLSKVGCHGYGVAADLGLFLDGTKYDPRGQDYMFFEALCAKHKLISGINWGTPPRRAFLSRLRPRAERADFPPERTLCRPLVSAAGLRPDRRHDQTRRERVVMLFFVAMFLRPLLCARCGKQLYECACEEIAAR